MPRPRYYDRKGNPISMRKWSALFNDPGYQRIALDEGNGKCVSTVWLGLDHSFSQSGPPLIFETMVFAEDSDSEIGCERYATEADAIKGHHEMAEMYVRVLDMLAKKVEEAHQLERTTVKVWSIQTEGAFERLREKGRLYGDWRRVWRHFKQPYRWICSQMESRGIELNGKPPMWAWERRPDLRRSGHLEKGEKGFLLELDVPGNLVLHSHFGAWHCVLNDHYMPVSDDELEGMFDHPRHEVEASWERIFDREVMARIPGHDDVYQATFPTIELDYVQSTKEFTSR